MWGWRSGRTIAVGAAMAAFALFCVLPLAYMIARWFPWREAAAYRDLVLDPRQRGLLLNTVVLGAGTAVAATLIGVPLGLALARMALPFKLALRILLAAPAVLPTYVVGLAWLYLSEGSWTHSLPAAVVVLTVVLYPLSMLMTEAAVRGIEPRLEEAASLTATPGRVLWRITLPLVIPSVLAAALVIFVLAVSDFAVPALLRVRVFTTEIFTAFAALYSFVRATTLAIPLLVAALLVALTAVRLAGDRLVARRRGLAGDAPEIFHPWRWPATGFIVCVVLCALVLPVAILAVEARQVSSWDRVVAGSGHAILNSLTLAALGATSVCALASGLAHARARAGPTAGAAADILFVVLFAVPGTIVGVALIGLWNRAGVAGAIYGTTGMFLLVYLARFTPLAALAVAALLRRVPSSQEEAAAVGGAGWFRTMTFIVLPQMKLGLLTVWVIVFTLAFGELGASVLVTPPGESTLPIRIYTLIANAPPAQIAALALLQVAVIFSPLAALGLGLAVRQRS